MGRLANRRTFLLALTASAFDFTQVAHAADSIKIGMVVSLTGPGAESGRYQVQGAKLAADEINKAKEKLQATWLFQSMEVNGQKVPEADIKDFKLVIRGDQFTYKGRGETKATIKTLDPTTTPTIIDLEYKDGPVKGVFEGINQLEGDTLKMCICVIPDARQRPTEFSAKEGSNQVLIVLKKENG